VGSALALPNSNVPAVPEGWADKFAEYVETSHSASENSDGWDWISSKGGVFQYLDSIVGKELEVIVLGATLENLYYDQEFNAAKKTPPACWALDGAGDVFGPINAPDPVHGECATCPNNEWASGKGRGKACRNYVRLVLVRANDPSGPGCKFRLPPTAITAWTKYAKKIEHGLGRPIFSVVTRLSIKPKGGSFTVLPEPASFVNDGETLEVLASRLDEATAELLRLYEPREDDEEKEASTEGQAF
jgi:hypothetical protein